jgi:DNA primase
MAYIDFAELKARLPIEEAIGRLDLTLKFANGQHRGPCPACRRGGPRGLAITPAKNAYYCFGAHAGGDVIALVAHIRDCSMKEAAIFLADKEESDEAPGSSADPKTTGPEERRKGNEERRLLQPLAYLEPAHPKVQALGLTEETCQAFGAGYAPKGIMRGRLAIPIHDWGGGLIAYCGRSVADDSPMLIFPNGFRPEAHIFNAHRARDGELILCRDPLEAVLANQNGVENVVAQLTDALSAEQLQAVAALMDERGCDIIEIH